MHSGTLASQCRRYLDAGFRLLVPDLPSHGYSSGLHVYQSNMAGFCTGLHAVLHDVARRDQLESPFPGITPTKLERRKTFMLGLSFGGLVAFSYALQYPSSYRYSETNPDEIPIDGLVGVGPMVACNEKFVVVNVLLRWLFVVMTLVFKLGRLEAIVPHKKVVDKDPKVYQSLIMQDPRSHQGSFRAGHMYCIVAAMHELRKRAHEIRHPIYIQMGGEDRVADNTAALKWIRETRSVDKRYEVYPVCQHVIYKKAKNQHDDLAGRISVIADNVEWMVERSPATYLTTAFPPSRSQLRLASYSSDSSSLSRSTSRTSLFDDNDTDQDEVASIATTVPTTPILTDTEVFHNQFFGQHDKKEAEANKFEARDERHLLPPHLRGWKADQEGEKRLYRLTWNFREDTRPFLYDPHAAPSSSA